MIQRGNPFLDQLFSKLLRDVPGIEIPGNLGSRLSFEITRPESATSAELTGSQPEIGPDVGQGKSVMAKAELSGKMTAGRPSQSTNIGPDIGMPENVSKIGINWKSPHHPRHARCRALMSGFKDASFLHCLRNIARTARSADAWFEVKFAMTEKHPQGPSTAQQSRYRPHLRLVGRAFLQN
ncbi:MAG TPA: hypothetical protein VIL84_14505 [Devosiaceae bacterium]